MFKIRLNVHFNYLFMNNEHGHKVNTKEKPQLRGFFHLTLVLIIPQ